MVRTVETASVTGLDVHPVRVEVSISRGTPMIQIVGLAQSAVREGRERIRAAASQLGLHVPGLRITVNLAPADRPKHGSGFDLPIVLGILGAAGEIPARPLEGTLVVGELGLDGRLRPIRGVLPIALHAARTPRVRRLIVPRDNLREAAAAAGIDARGARSLSEVIGHLTRGEPLPGAGDLPSREPDGSGSPPPDLSTVLGHSSAKRALEIAAAGGHNVLLSGPPGSGKTSLARCLPGLLVPLTTAEAVEVTAIHSVAGALRADSGLVRERPFRAPHHSISTAGLLGGGSLPRPGEISLAHEGVLFLDELPEFGRPTLEAMRQPLEEGIVHIVRARAAATFPARFTLVSAMNPCACGFLGSEGRVCRCTEGDIRRYRRRLSGPLLDRIDLRVDVPALTWSELGGAGDPAAKASPAVRERVLEARARAARREKLGRRAAPNGGSPRGVRAAPRPTGSGSGALRPRDLDPGARSLLRLAVERFGLSARGFHRTLRVARTIADLAGSERIGEEEVAEALRYRGEEGADGEGV